MLTLATAPASARPLGSGASDLDLSTGPLVRTGYVEPIEPALSADEEFEVIFPIEGKSDLDPATGRGTIRYRGAMFLGRDKRRVTLTGFEFRRTAKRTTLTAKISGFCRAAWRGGNRTRRCVPTKRIELLRLLKVQYQPLDPTGQLSIESEAWLTRFAARALNMRLATSAFKGDRYVGTLGVFADWR